MSKHDLYEWMAGIFEGEGCVYISLTRGKYYKLGVEVCMTNEQIVRVFDREFPAGWNIKEEEEYRKMRYRWLASGEKAIYFIEVLRPHIKTTRVKTKFNVATRFFLAQQQKNIPAMQEYREQMLRLNKKGR